MALNRTKWLAVLLAAGLLSLAGCKVGPDYKRPVVDAPRDWRWKAAEPSDHLPKGAWWRLFGDSTLDGLEQKATEQNQDLKAAAARIEQSRAIARLSRSDLFPGVTGSAAFNRVRTSGNAPSPVGFPIPSLQISEWKAPFDLSYEVDLWGKVRRSFEAARQEAVGSVAARDNLLLTVQADVAATYFQLTGTRAEMTALEEAIRLRQEALNIFQQRLGAGVGTEFEVERTKVELASARADLLAAKRTEAELINALAILCGQAPGSFRLEATNAPPAAPRIAADLPSSLLERRPDVAEAERTLAARSARIGVAKAAYFPSIRLTAQGGFQSGELQDLLQWESRTWGIGPSVSVPIFQGGRIRANVAQAKAAYDEALAKYRQQVLVAFKDVDDSLAAERFLREQLAERDAAVAAARNAARMALNRFSAGTVSFLEVVDAEAARLQSELARIRVATSQLTVSVRLVKALGGGWQAASPSS